MRSYLTPLLLLSLTLSPYWSNSIFGADPIPFIDFPQTAKAPTILSPLGWIQQKALQESSGLARSADPQTFWSCNDSGHGPILYAIHADGSVPPHAQHGCTLASIDNIDWESLCNDGHGHLIIADVGNNANRRRQLQLYWIAEPDISDSSAAVLRTVNYIYPDQKEFPPQQNNFDCEAIAVIGHTLQIITKHRADRHASVYQIDTQDPSHSITKKATLNLHEQVTGASVSPLQKKIALLTYQGIWIFDISQDQPQKWWHNQAYHLPIIAMQCEAILFINENTLAITNEQGAVFQVDTENIPTISRINPSS